MVSEHGGMVSLVCSLFSISSREVLPMRMIRVDVYKRQAYFSTSTFVNGIKKEVFSLISRFRDNACLFYVYAVPRTGKRGRPKTKDGKIDMKNLDLTRMEKMEMKDIEGTAYTLIAYSKALRCNVRLVIWQMPNGKKKLFFSTDTSLSGEEVLLYYRTRFQIEFCFRDAKGYTGLMDLSLIHILFALNSPVPRARSFSPALFLVMLNSFSEAAPYWFCRVSP